MSDKLRRLLMLSTVAFAWPLATYAAQDPPTDRTMPAETTTRHDMPAPDRTAMKDVTPQEFAKQAAVIGKAEIELGQLAMERTQDANVRKFAQQMVKDHSAAAAKLEKVASKDGLTLPQSLDPEHEAVKEKLSALKGEAFDREYAKTMAMGHDKAVALFKSASQSSSMPADLKQFAAATLPTLQEHKDEAHALHEKEGV